LVEAEVVSARELDEDVREMLLAFIAKELPGLKIGLKETVDEKLIGGAILRLPDRVLDFSVASQIKELAKALKS
jgi:F-type H+-transporting ATPase subunit delta